MGVTITYTKVMALVKNHLHDESSKGRTSAKPHGESGFESQLIDLLHYAEKDQQYDSRSFENKLLTLGILD